MSAADVEVDVLIVGGGGCGLAASVMLSDLGVDHLLIERHPETAPVPKAHIINPRTMEIFTQHGLAADVYRLGAPQENNSAMRWYTSLGGDERWHQQLVHRCDAWGGGNLRTVYADYSAQRHGNTPQRILEPLLRRHAEVRAPNRVRFHHGLLDFTQSVDGVVARVHDRNADVEYTVRCEYLIGADGGRTVGPQLGVAMEGPEAFVQTESVYFKADLSPYLHDDDALVRFFNRPTLHGDPVRTGLVAAGPTRWDRHSEEWTISVTLTPEDDPGDFDDRRAIAAIRERLNLPDLQVTVLRHMRWSIEALLADRYAVGRVFLAGDAAHKHSPFGGLGLNTAIQDAHNLAWKLSCVLSGRADKSLLETYETERRPVGRTNVDYATVAFFNTLSAMAGFGLLQHATADYNRAVLESLFSDTRIGAQRRARLREYFDSMRMEGQAADIELGFEYSTSAAVVADATAAPDRDPTGHRYIPTTRPGHRLPHAWLERDGRLLGTHSLLRTGSFLLIAGDDGHGWCEAAHELMTKEQAPDIVSVRVGPHAGLRDRFGRWAELRGHDERGAVLIRPDGHVAARFAPGQKDQTVTEFDQLRSALNTVLGSVQRQV